MSEKKPIRLGVVIFPGFAILDVAGPLQYFDRLSSIIPMEMSILAAKLQPVSTCPPNHLKNNEQYPSIGCSWIPTHTFETSPEIDILLVPGGYGTRDPAIFDETTMFIRNIYPKVEYLLSVCTGAALVAAAGIIDGRKATTNKFAWAFATRHSAVQWIRKARWVVDGNVWSSSGVAAGMDMIHAFISKTFSSELAQKIANIIEYEPHTDSQWDPFSDIWGAEEKSQIHF